MTHRSQFWLALLAVVVTSAVVGSFAYNAGVAHGLALTADGAARSPTWGPAWGYPGFHPFGFVFPLFFLFGVLFLVRMLMFGGRRHWGPSTAWGDRLDQWHREAHERMNKPV